MRVKPFRIVSTSLVNLTTGDKKPLSFYSGSSKLSTDLVQLTVKESMFSPSLEGEAIIRDYSTAVEQLDISIGNYDAFRVMMEQINDGGESKILTLDLSIYAYSQETSEAEIQIGQENIARIISLKLASKEHYIMNYNFFEFMDDDKIIKISYTPEKENGNAQEGKSGDEEGLVQYLIDRIAAVTAIEGGSGGSKTVPLKADNTRNWIWLKSNHNFYPWGKFIKAPRLSQLMQLLAENAVDDGNNNAVNFFFWQDMENWNFRSVESIVREYGEREDLKTYYIAPQMNKAESIRSLNSGSDDEIHVSSSEETDFFDLLRSYAFGSLYTFVEPKYKEDPYARYLDTQDGHIYQDIYYDYFEDKDRWRKIEGDTKLLKNVGKSGKENLFIKNVGKNLIADTKYGYFSPNFFNKKKSVSWEYSGYQYSNRDEEELWQTQFDITDMPGKELKLIQEKIKNPLKKKKEQYAKKKNLKEKWKVYKCSICCAGNIGGISAGISGASAGISGGFTSIFSDPRFDKSFNLRNTSSLLSNYEIVAAGSFTDVINFDASKIGIIGGSGPSGPSGSIGITSDPWISSGMTLSYNLNESPYSLTIGEFLSLERQPDNFVKYRFDLEIARHQKLIDILRKNIEAREIRKIKYTNAVAGYTHAYIDRNDICNFAGCTGNCLCPTEYPETVQIKTDFVVGAHDALIDHEEKIIQETQTAIQKLNTLKTEFEDLYDKYWSRNAFFFSRDIDFSFLKSGNNLFNIKSITRKPIKGSRYEPFAEYKNLLGASGISLSSGILGASGISGPDLVKSFYYDRKYDVGVSGSTGNYTDFWASFDHPYGNFPYSEAGEERPKGPIWYRNWLVNYQITIIKPPCLNRKPPCFEGDCSCDEINLNLNMHFETFSNVKDADILTSPNQIAEYAFTQLSKNCDGCKIRILAVYPASEIKLYHPWGADLLPGLTNFGYDDYKDYKRSASLFKSNPGLSGGNSGENIPPHLMLEGMESYVRVEFTTPITGNSQDFVEFVDTYGSEYFMPYIVLATAGPFGPEAARTNIAVIGQDAHGFDLAVKKIKNRDDYGSMNLIPLAGKDPITQTSPGFNYSSPFSTSSSWLKTNQNSLFYKPADGVADLFVPNGIQDIFMASALEKSLPAKTWWDLWVSLPPIAVATFYNRHDVMGVMGGSGSSRGPSGIGGPGVAFYSNNSIVAEPYLWAGDSGGISGYSGPFGCSGGCSGDLPWPLFLHPDTEQIASGAFASNVAVLPRYDVFESAEFLTGISGVSGGSGDNLILIPGSSASILGNDPSNYIYKIAEFPHILTVSSSGSSGSSGSNQPSGKKYDSISYPVGTLIWGSDLRPISGSGTTGVKYDYNYVHEYDISRKTRYGIVQLHSDSMPSLVSLIGGVGGEIEKVQEYHKWISRKLTDWYQNSIFDNNFSAQFVVLSKESNYCKGYPCMNPDGFPGVSGCPPQNPLCNCPCQGPSGNIGQLMSSYIGATGSIPKELVLRPDLMNIIPDRFFGGITMAPIGSYGPEPSSLELEMLEKELSECNLIKANLGEEWLGCVWDKPDSSYNCSCPKIGRRFFDYMKYNRTYSTFWETPLAAPLLRTAQMALLNSNKINISVAGDLDIKAGQIIKIESNGVQNKRFRGKWLVTTVNRFFNRAYHMMTLTLSREGEPKSTEG